MPTALPTWKHHLKIRDGCYYCGASAESLDHVPPAAFFPDADAYRMNLVKVPACSAHNQGFSEHDPIVAAIVAMVLEANPLAFQQFQDKLRRAFEKDRQMVSRIMPSVTVYQDKQRGIDIPVMEIDRQRFINVMERIAKGLHFFTWRTRWPGALRVECEQLRGPQLTVPFESMFRELRYFFFTEKVLGANPRVFHYQWHDGFVDSNGQALRILGMRFFDGLGCYAWGPPP